MMERWLDPIPDILDRVLQEVAEWLWQSHLKLNQVKMEVLYLSHGGGGDETEDPAPNPRWRINGAIAECEEPRGELGCLAY